MRFVHFQCRLKHVAVEILPCCLRILEFLCFHSWGKVVLSIAGHIQTLLSVNIQRQVPLPLAAPSAPPTQTPPFFILGWLWHYQCEEDLQDETEAKTIGVLQNQYNGFFITLFVNQVPRRPAEQDCNEADCAIHHALFSHKLLLYLSHICLAASHSSHLCIDLFIADGHVFHPLFHYVPWENDNNGHEDQPDNSLARKFGKKNWPEDCDKSDGKNNHQGCCNEDDEPVPGVHWTERMMKDETQHQMIVCQPKCVIIDGLT
mmetsp:Transcript_22548/g.43225  ORF Transcript_22548/g.43225 Transcript_22548/m.43225 type:complete len:260 (+) Transcript_22548:541-1320(+)